MAKRQTRVGDIFKGAKRLAAGVVAVEERVAISKQYERIVPVPQIDTYSELPFALVEKAGQRVPSADSVRASDSTSRETAQPRAKKAKRTAKKKAPKKETKRKVKK